MVRLEASGRALVILAIIYGLTAKGYVESLDTVFSVATAESIVSHGRLDIPERRDGYTLTGVDGKSYSKFGIGLAFYFTPFVAAGHAIAALTGCSEPEVTGFLISFAQIPFVLLLLALFARCLHRLGAPPAAIAWATVALGLGTLCWHYATCDLSEAMQAALLFGAYYGVIQRERSGALLAGGAFALLVLVKLVHVVLLPLFLLYLLLPDGDLREERGARSGLFLAPVLLIGLVIAWLNLHRFGSPLESGYGSEASLFIPGQLWHTLPALLLSPDKGLLLFAPVLLAGLLGFPAFFRRHPREAVLSLAIVAVVFLVAGAWHSWEGGWSWGPRLLVPAIALVFLPAGFLPRGDARSPRRRGLMLLAVLSILAQVPGILVNDQEIHRIKLELLRVEERPSAPSDLAMGWLLAAHKVAGGAERYSVSAFRVHDDRELDLTGYRSFQGVNLWSEHAARLLGRPWLRLVPLMGVLAIILLLIGEWRLPPFWMVPSASH